jgi:protoporphyrinogen IX oxidase
METLYKVILSIHLVAVISWMAGLLYLFRLFIYHTEETEEVVMSRFRVMEERLYRIITAPAMGIAFVAGSFMLSLHPELLGKPWMWGKLALVVGMAGLTGKAGGLRRTLARGEKRLTSKQLRFLNEVPTLLMIGIVFLVILKPWS